MNPASASGNSSVDKSSVRGLIRKYSSDSDVSISPPAQKPPEKKKPSHGIRIMEENKSILWLIRQKTFVSEVEVGIPCPLTALYKVNVIILYKESIQCFFIVLIKKSSFRPLS